MLTILEINTDHLFDQVKKKVDPARLIGRITLLNFWSTECPSCKQTDPELLSLKQRFPDLRLIAVLSNQNEDPEDAMSMFSTRGYDELWIDPDAQLAKELQAITAPTVFLFDEKGVLRYHGAINDRSFRKKVAEVNYVANALELLSTGKPVEPSETASYGCAIVDVKPDQG